MLLNLQMVMHEPWKASAPEVYLLTTTDGSVPRGLDPNGIHFTATARIAPDDELFPFHDPDKSAIRSESGMEI